MKPRIFVSAVSRELRSARQIIANTLMALGYEPIWQDIFNVSSSDIRPMLRDKIDSCSAVIQIIGDAYGAEPSTPEATFGRVSYTQYEALYAQAKGKPVYYLLAQDNSPRDMDPRSVDQPIEDSDAARADADERRALQRKYRESILATEHIYYTVQSHTETELTIRRLKDELNRLRRGLRSWMIGVTAGLVFIAATVTWIMLGLPGLKQSIKEAEQRTAVAIKELANPAVLADRIKNEIRSTAESRIKALSQTTGNAEEIAEVELERELAIEHVDDLVQLIQVGLQEGANPVFERAAQILVKESTDQSLAYLESRRESMIKTALRHSELASRAQARAQVEIELRNKSLEPLLLESDLLESKLKWEEALDVLKKAAVHAQDWYEPQLRLGTLYSGLARFADAEPHLRESLRLAKTPEEETLALTELAILLEDTNRVVQAELFARRALLIDEKTNGSVHSYVARDLNILALSLQNFDRVAEAESLLRRALAINESLSGEQVRENTVAVLGNLSHSMFRSNRLGDAELLLRRSLALQEEYEGSGSQNAGICVGNIGQLLSGSGRPAEAEALAHHSLKIKIRLQGEDHPNVASGLDGLAQSLQQMGRTEEAEMARRRAAIIKEKAGGIENLQLAYYLNKLARSYVEAKQLEKAEPLMRRCVIILRSLEINSGRAYPNSQDALSFYRGLLGRMNYPSEKIEELVKSANEPEGPLDPIAVEMERLLGPTKSVSELMSALDERYKKENRPAIYFLAPEKPITPLLQEFLRPTAVQLSIYATFASDQKNYAEAVVLFDEAFQIMTKDEPGRLNLNAHFASALRKLGDIERASQILHETIRTMDQDPSATPATKGSVHYQSAICAWHRGDFESAKRESEAALNAFGDDPELAPSKRVTEEMLAELKANKSRPPLPEADVYMAQLEAARLRIEARNKFALLPITEKASPLLDVILGPAMATEEVFRILDEQYRKEGKPEFWFVPIDKPLGPHLDMILGPLPTPEPANAD